MVSYLSPSLKRTVFAIFAFESTLILKAGLGVIWDNCKWLQSIDCVWLHIHVLYSLACTFLTCSELQIRNFPTSSMFRAPLRRTLATFPNSLWYAESPWTTLWWQPHGHGYMFFRNYTTTWQTDRQTVKTILLPRLAELTRSKKQENPAIADNPIRRLRRHRAVYVRTVGLQSVYGVVARVIITGIDVGMTSNVRFNAFVWKCAYIVEHYLLVTKRIVFTWIFMSLLTFQSPSELRSTWRLCHITRSWPIARRSISESYLPLWASM